MPVRCVALDWGGVMVLINRTWSAALAHAGLPPKDLGRLSAFPAHELLGSEGWEDAAYFESLGAFLGLGVADARSAHDGVLVGEYPGMFDLVEDLRRRGLRVAALTNTDPAHAKVVMTYPSVQSLDCVVASFEVGHRKPAEAIYRAFEEAVGCAPNEIVYFDDLKINVDGAEECGWRAFLVDPATDPVAQIHRRLTELGVL